MVPADSRRIPRAPRYSGAGSPAARDFAYGALTLCGPPFQGGSAVPAAGFAAGPTTPAPALTGPVWAPPRSLAATCGITFCFLFLRVLRCFSSPGWPPRSARMSGSLQTGCPIRKSGDLRAFAPPPGLSQLVASFLASESQGILHAPSSPFSFPFERGLACLLICMSCFKVFGNFFPSVLLCSF